MIIQNAMKYTWDENLTGLIQILKVGPTCRLEIPMRGLRLAQNLGQPCGFYVWLRPYSLRPGKPNVWESKEIASAGGALQCTRAHSELTATTPSIVTYQLFTTCPADHQRVIIVAIVFLCLRALFSY